jgi:hypothetical protein
MNMFGVSKYTVNNMTIIDQSHIYSDFLIDL